MARSVPPSKPAAASDGLSLACFVAGPRSRSVGRNYELTYLSPSASLTPAANSRLNDFILALASWAGRGEERFSIFFPLDSQSGQHVVAIARYLGRGERGTVAVAHGVLLGPDEIAAIRRRPHRLLQRVPEPGENDWRPEVLHVDEGILSTPSRPDPLLRDFGDFLARHRAPLRLAADGPAASEILLRLLESAPLAIVEHAVTWSSTARLPVSGQFDPSRLDLLIEAADGPSSAASATHRLTPTEIVGPINPPPPEWRTWLALFGEAGEELAPGAAALLSRALFRESYFGAAIEKVIRQTVSALVTPDLRIADFWALLARLSDRAAGLEDSRARELAARGIVRAFEAVAPADSRRAGSLLRQFLDSVPLHGGWSEVRRFAAARGLLGQLGPRVAFLVGDDMDDNFSDALVGDLQTGRFAPEATSAIAAGLPRLRQIRSPHYLRLAPALIGAAAGTDPDGSPEMLKVGLAAAEELYGDDRADGDWVDMAVRSASSAARLAASDPTAGARLIDTCLAAMRLERQRPRGSGQRAPEDPAWARAALAFALAGAGGERQK
jgi:hypothetical protein